MKAVFFIFKIRVLGGEMLRVFESFAGIGTQRMGLERAGIAHEVVQWTDQTRKVRIVR